MHKTVPMLAVESSQIAQIGHDFATKTLRIRFANKADGTAGALYEYANVSLEFFEKFRSAPSIGSFFYANIKKAPLDFPYKKLEPIYPADACAAIVTMGKLEDMTAYMEALPVPVRVDYRVEEAFASRMAYLKIAAKTSAAA